MDFRVSSSIRGLDCEVKVCDLIDQNLGIWNRELLVKCFDIMVIQQILSIPLSLRRLVDKLIWHNEQHEEYTVKFAYHLLGVGKQQFCPRPSSTLNKQLWKNIWNALVHNQIRNFLWGLVKNILPTNCKLQQKGVRLDNLCHSFSESVHTLFMQYDVAKLVFFSPH